MTKPLSAKLRKSTKTKAKKTIRKMASPSARRLAHISQDILAIQKRLNALTEEFESDYRELKALEKALKGDKPMSQKTAVEAGLEVRELLDHTTDDDHPGEEVTG